MARFNDDFPTIKSMKMKITKTGHSSHCELKEMRGEQHSEFFSAATLPDRNIKCANPQCRNSGWDWKEVISTMIKVHQTKLPEKTSFPCPGFRKCLSFFHVAIDLEYNE